mmetsp:Transcript_10316/g.28366  ORF Transcript_10316/g.28366 Transcript_10316/m.28366 type:complete len:134 (+) Transcript_10316:3718-4119(+)
MFGIIKETGVDDEGLKEFYDQYFSYPLYRDVDNEVYKALGSRSIFSSSTTYNPFKLYRAFNNLKLRLKEKNVEGNMKGEGLVAGGLILYDKAGKPVFVYEEETGSPIEMDQVKEALEAVKSNKPIKGDASTEL